jgi:PAS domain S-box-containing protein
MDAIEIVNRTSLPAVATDQGERILGWNGAAQRLFGYSAQRVVGRELQEFLRESPPCGQRGRSNRQRLFEEMVYSGRGLPCLEFEACKPSGEVLRVAASVVVIVGPEPSMPRFVYLMKPLAIPPRGVEEDAGASPPKLTPRQLDVLRLMAAGQSTDEIADALCVTVHTVRSHIQQIHGSLGVGNRLAAVCTALRLGLV